MRPKLYSSNFGELTYVVKVPTSHADPAKVLGQDLLFCWFLRLALGFVAPAGLALAQQTRLALSSQHPPASAS